MTTTTPTPGTAHRDCLYAFFDLEIAPPGYNVTNFLVLADIERERRRLDAVHVVIVPGSADGFRAEDVEYPRLNKEWRVRNIVVPACALLPACAAVTVCRSRDEARALLAARPAEVFPTGYSVAAPIAYHDYASINAAAQSGVRIPRLRAPEQARQYVAQWLDARAGGRKPVVVTLREASYDIGRNSDVEAWAAFAKRLDPTVYFAVVVRDTEAVFGPTPEVLDGLANFREASVNLEIRAALYESAYLSVGINQGPTTLWHFVEGVSYLTMYVIDRMYDGWERYHVTGSGFVRGEDMRWAGPAQRTYWGNDTRAEIEREFAVAVAQREGSAAMGARAERQKAQDPIELAMGYQTSGQHRHAVELYERVLAAEPRNARARALLGMAYAAWGKYSEAVRHLAEALMLSGPNAACLSHLAFALHKLGRTVDAIRWLDQAVALAPDDPAMRDRLGEHLLSTGRAAEAVPHFAALADLLPDQTSLRRKWADALLATGDNAAAIAVLVGALRREAAHAPLWLRLGDALDRAGRAAEAMGCFRVSAKLNHGHLSAAEATAALDAVDPRPAAAAAT